MMNLPDSRDTIVAISTPPGYGGIGVVRISGEQAFAVTSRLVDERSDFSAMQSHTLHHCHISESAANHFAQGSKIQNRIVDEVLVAVFKSPRSYTGEDVTEVSAHGNPRILQRIVDLALAHGCRQAMPGEFTLRAFQSGRIDLVQAESVADLIAAEGTAFQQAAMYQLSGSLSQFLGKLREELLGIAALFEAYTDFPDEEIPQKQGSELSSSLTSVRERLENIARSYREGNVIRHGVQVPILGPPNAGKSSLFNAILAEERAIVTELPGTTRDTISEKIDYKGLVVRLVDTAGLRDTTDQIEALGVARSKRELAGSDVLVLLFDASEVDVGDVERAIALVAEKRFLLVFNKVDLVDTARRESLSQLYAPRDPLFLSAREISGIEPLLDAIHARVLDSHAPPNLAHTLTNRRHYDAVNSALNSLARVESGLIAAQSSELLAFDLRQCIDQLEGILGKVTNEDLLAEIFGRFCIGK